MSFASYEDYSEDCSEDCSEEYSDDNSEEYYADMNTDEDTDEYTPHPFPFYKEILLRPRRTIKEQDPVYWPWSKKQRKNALEVNCQDLTMTLKAMRHVEKRRDIDFLIVKVEDLFVLPFWQVLNQLLAKQDRDWSIQLRCSFFTSQRRCEKWPNMKTIVIKALSVLQYATFLNLTNDRDGPDSYDQGLLFILKHLPEFRNLHMLNIGYHYWEGNLDPILALPFVHQMSGLGIGSNSLAYAAHTSGKALQQLREIGVSIGCYEESFYQEDGGGDSSIIGVAAKCLPSLQRLDVTFPFGNDSEKSIKKLVDWLVSPNCKVSELRVYVYNPKSFSVIWDVVPRMRTLRSLMLDFADKLNIREMLNALKRSPALDFLSLNSISLPTGGDKELLEYQLACKPRMLEIRVITRSSEDHTYYDQIHLNSLEYQRKKGSAFLK